MRQFNHQESVQAVSCTPNKQYYEIVEVVERFGKSTKLFKAEEIIFASLQDEIKDQPILDIGVGGGRTMPHLKAISRNYIGTDYSANMINLCRQRDSEASLLVCDARRMSLFADEQFTAVFFCFNGIDEVTSADRVLVLKEIYRVLKTNGIFVFSSHNLDWQAIPFYALTGLSFLPEPRLFIRQSMLRIKAYGSAVLAYLRNHMQKNDYAIISEYEESLGLLLPTHYIKKEAQIGQLLDTGFRQVETIDSNGFQIGDEKSAGDAWLYYVARKR
jgi:ubiquinone/menaquinone biosynthesis C-methylase UbiE